MRGDKREGESMRNEEEKKQGKRKLVQRERTMIEGKRKRKIDR